MKLIEALQFLQQPHAPDDPVFEVYLACGFTPLHLATFLAAHLQRQYPSHRIALRTGLYGDLPGTLDKLAREAPGAAVIALEWTDLDPRLGIRQLGGWGPREGDDILTGACRRAAALAELFARIPGRTVVALSLPTLPLPPVWFTAGWQSGAAEWELRAAVLQLAAAAARLPNFRVLSQQHLDRISPLEERRDAGADIAAGFPFKPAHAALLAESLTRLLGTRAPRKGLITDLDHTLWSGIVGEVGPAGISWDLDHGTHLHGLYQQFLKALAEEGVLLAVASKNDPAVVAEAFTRQDLILPPSRIFPVEVHWKPKSESIARILQAWNIHPDSVVFIDDSPMELGEAQAAHPGLHCMLFPGNNAQALYTMLGELRNLFGKTALSKEDALRPDSIRQNARLQLDAGNAGADSEGFLAALGAEITFRYAKDPPDRRALELVNKTNQFNLNGRRHTEATWQAELASPCGFLCMISYRDKYGPLGKIAVLAGRVTADELHLHTWAMSCRAFSRRIEHRTIAELFDYFSVSQIRFDFESTPRNGPMRSFLGEFAGDTQASGMLTREHFFSRRPSLYGVCRRGTQ